MPRRRTIGMLALLLAGAALARSQEPKATSGTKPGDVIPGPFRAFMVVDDRFPPKKTPPVKAEDRDPRDRTNKIHDLVSENNQGPVAAVFIRADPKALGPGVTKLIQALDKLIPEYRGDRMAGFVMFLRAQGVAKDFEDTTISTTLKNPDDTKTGVEVAYGKELKSVTITDPKGNRVKEDLNFEYPDDEQRAAHADAIRTYASGVKAPNVPFGLAPVRSKATEAWGLAEGDEVTVVIYNRLRVAGRWTFKAEGPTDEQIQQIVAAVKEMITGEKPKK